MKQENKMNIIIRLLKLYGFDFASCSGDDELYIKDDANFIYHCFITNESGVFMSIEAKNNCFSTNKEMKNFKKAFYDSKELEHILNKIIKNF